MEPTSLSLTVAEMGTIEKKHQTGYFWSDQRPTFMLCCPSCIHFSFTLGQWQMGRVPTIENLIHTKLNTHFGGIFQKHVWFRNIDSIDLQRDLYF